MSVPQWRNRCGAGFKKKLSWFRLEWPWSFIVSTPLLWFLLLKAAYSLNTLKFERVAFYFFSLKFQMGWQNGFSRWTAGHGVWGRRAGRQLCFACCFSLLGRRWWCACFTLGIPEDHMWIQAPLSSLSHARWRALSLKALELISWYQYLFKFVSGLLLTFTSNTRV